MESLGVRVPPDRRLPVAQWMSNVPLPEPHLIGIAAAIWLHRVRPLTLPGPGTCTSLWAGRSSPRGAISLCVLYGRRGR